MRIFFSALFVTLLSLAGASAAAASEASGEITWSLAPSDADGPDGRQVIDVIVEPGETYREHVALVNHSDETVTFDLQAADGYLTEGGTFDLRAGHVEPVGGGAWIEFDDEMTLGPRDQVVLPLEISPPSSVTPGDYPSGVTAGVSTVDGTVKVENRVGVRVNVRVPGTATASIDIEDLSTSYASGWNPFEPGELTVGAVLDATGTAEVSVEEFAEVAGPAGIGPTASSSSARTLDLLPGEGVATSLTIPNVWQLGAVTTTFTVTPSTENPNVDAVQEPHVVTLRTWAMPWPQLGLLACVVLVGTGLRGWTLGRRRRIRKMMESARAEGAATERQRRDGAQHPGNE